MKNILITGGAGFIGLNLALELLEQNHSVIIVDDFKNSYVQHIKNLAKNFKNLTYYKGDCCDEKFMNHLFKSYKFEIVFHLAAKKYIRQSVVKPIEYTNNNINSLKVVLKLSSKYNIKRLMFPSSSSVYGNCNKKIIDEGCNLNPLNPYSQTRALGEHLIAEWSAKAKIPATIFRFANPVGANTKYFLGDHSKQHQMQLFPYVISKAINNQEIVLRGNNFNTPDGTPIRDYIYVSDLARIVAFVTLNSSNTNVEILNLGSGGEGYSTLQIVTATQQVLNKPVSYSFTASSAFEVEKITLNCDKLFNNYAIRPSSTLQQIIQSQIDFEKHITKRP